MKNLTLPCFLPLPAPNQWDSITVKGVMCQDQQQNRATGSSGTWFWPDPHNSKCRTVRSSQTRKTKGHTNGYASQSHIVFAFEVGIVHVPPYLLCAPYINILIVGFLFLVCVWLYLFVYCVHPLFVWLVYAWFAYLFCIFWIVYIFYLLLLSASFISLCIFITLYLCAYFDFPLFVCVFCLSFIYLCIVWFFSFCCVHVSLFIYCVYFICMFIASALFVCVIGHWYFPLFFIDVYLCSSFYFFYFF